MNPDGTADGTIDGRAADGGAVVIAGLGSEYRHDDAVGLVVSQRAERMGTARDVGPLGEPLDLLGRWDGAALAIVIDAVSSGARPGTIRVMDLSGADAGSIAPDPSGAVSSHGIDVTGVLRLAQAVGRAPLRVVVVGIEGEDFSPGIGLTARVGAAVPEALRQVERLALGVRPCA